MISTTKYEQALSLWQQKRIEKDAELAEALNVHSISFAYHSGKIENQQITYHDTREIFEHDGVTSYTGDLRTLFEIRNARDANEMFLTAFQEKRPFDETFLKELQMLLTQNTYDTRRWQLGERPGRLAMNYFLVMHDHPPVIIHEEDRRDYYAALEAWDAEQNLEPLRIFLKDQTAKTWEKQIARAEQKKE